MNCPVRYVEEVRSRIMRWNDNDPANYIRQNIFQCERESSHGGDHTGPCIEGPMIDGGDSARAIWPVER